MAIVSSSDIVAQCGRETFRRLRLKGYLDSCGVATRGGVGFDSACVCEALRRDREDRRLSPGAAAFVQAVSELRKTARRLGVRV